VLGADALCSCRHSFSHMGGGGVGGGEWEFGCCALLLPPQLFHTWGWGVCHLGLVGVPMVGVEWVLNVTALCSWRPQVW